MTQKDTLPLDKLTSDDFRPHLNQKFLVHYGQAETLEVELIEVAELRQPHQEPVAGKRIPFSLIWRSSSRTQYLPQHTFTVTHETMGSLMLFIVPLGSDSVGMRYQAILA